MFEENIFKLDLIEFMVKVMISFQLSADAAFTCYEGLLRLSFLFINVMNSTSPAGCVWYENSLKKHDSITSFFFIVYRRDRPHSRKRIGLTKNTSMGTEKN